jgi:hypothetical protein
VAAAAAAAAAEKTFPGSDVYILGLDFRFAFQAQACCLPCLIPGLRLCSDPSPDFQAQTSGSDFRLSFQACSIFRLAVQAQISGLALG